ncbi:MAG: tRNA (adenosine(37)-N6)-threonylcarbamoyltransferase complex ATPase subunit type 1 TsaE [Phycisphaerales bacterium]|nr:tRNA (adenosine(37)-N6)-threonylcarbamoyltransferase complex ATPase subunit type 1 TsaE [Phycisphaerales bacterium]
MKGEFLTASPEETLALGQALGRALAPGLVIALTGHLGAGKTLLVKGIAAGNGLPDTRNVTSPTFTLVQEYEGRLPIRHLDVYRLKAAKDLLALGFEEMCAAPGVVIVEWADQMPEAMPHDTLWIKIESTADTTRRITWQTSDPKAAARIRSATPAGAPNCTRRGIAGEGPDDQR